MTPYHVTALIWSVVGFLAGYNARLLLEAWFEEKTSKPESVKQRVEKELARHMFWVMLVGLCVIGGLLMWRAALRAG